MFVGDIGFTGTRWGMQPAQQASFTSLIAVFRGWKLRHGDCVGADEEAHDIAEACGLVPEIHPPEDEKFRAFKQALVIHPQKTHFARNRDIVNASVFMIATPAEFEPQDRGGTWYTIGYAKQVGKKTIIIRPDGTLR